MVESFSARPSGPDMGTTLSIGSRIYNAKNLSNLSDRQRDLEDAVKARFAEYAIRIVGCGC
jgi:hypothetical protein